MVHRVADDEAAKKLAEEHHIAYEERHKKGDIINLFFEEFCEKELIQPTFIMDHPIEISPSGIFFVSGSRSMIFLASE